MKFTLLHRRFPLQIKLTFYALLFAAKSSFASVILFDDEPRNGAKLWATSSSESTLTQIGEPVVDGERAISMQAHYWTQSGLRIAQVPPFKNSILEAKIYRKSGNKGSLMFRRGNDSLKINLDETNNEFWTLDGMPGHNNFSDDTWHTIRINLNGFNLDENEKVLAIGIQGPLGTGIFYMDSVSFIEGEPDNDISPPLAGNWELTFEDNFNSTLLNPNNWHVGKQYLGMSGIAGNAGRETIRIENEMLQLESEKNTLNQGTKRYFYKAAEVSTFRKFRQKYGYFEAKIKYDSVHGAWPAFWLLPDKGIYGNNTYRRQSLLKFNLDDVSTTISSAFLRLKISEANTQSSIAVHKTLSTDWTQDTVTWNTKPQIDPLWFSHSYGEVTGNIIEVDVTSYIREQKNSGKEASFALIDNYMRSQLIKIFSSESNNISDRPALIVNEESLSPTEDAFVRGGNYADTNFGQEPLLLIKDTWGDTSPTFDKGMEFDIMESLGIWGEDISISALHWDGYGSQHKSISSGELYHNYSPDGFHVYGMHWEPGFVGMYIDGEKVWEHYDDRVGSLPSYIILSLQVGGWDGNEKNISDDFEANMLVDFVRVWSNSEFN